MEILTETQHRALAFIATVNLGGYAPSAHEVDQWLEEPTPARAGSFYGAGLLDSMSLVADYLYGQGASAVVHLESLGWIREQSEGGFQLTDLGQALLRATDTEDQAQGQVVVLDHQSPLAYASLIGELSEAGNALLIDPYLDLEHLIDLERHTKITRAVISTKHSSEKRGTIMKSFIEKRTDTGVEVRHADELHDRVIVAEDGRVWTLGMSLNGVRRQKSITVLTPLPEPGAEALALWAKSRWEEAQPLVQEAPDEKE